ncbi:MAG: succinate dehydrogenase, hydrophobic membrane anchor protein [Holosporales bacterium]|jgi:succinate dehydrogenase / fumarate reductase membrane anchor subunit
MVDSLSTPLKRVRGLGSAKSGVQHWWLQRLTAIVLIPLTLWAFYILVQIPTLNAASAADFLSSPLQGLGVFALLTAMLWHAKLGLIVVVEDYLHSTAIKVVLLIIIKILAAAGIVASGLAIAKLIISAQ